MEKFGKTIKQRLFWGTVIVVFAISLSILDQTGLLFEIEFIKKHENLSNFQIAFVMCIAIVAIFMMSKYRKALKDKSKLQILYNQENDERLQLVRQKSGMPMVMITSTIMIFAGIIAGYLNETVFHTLIAASLIQLTICLFAKIYYMRKI